jgi:prophage regulatory protein
MSEQVNTTATILRRVQVQARTGLPRTSMYKLIKEGNFPKQVSLGGPRAVGWRSGDIDQWLESRPVKS